MQHLLEFLNKLVDDFSWRRLSLILSCLAIFVIALIVYEAYTGAFFLSKAEKTIHLIKELSSLPPEIIGDSQARLSSTAGSVANQLHSFTESRPFHFEVSSLAVKVFCTSMPWLITLIIAALIEKNEKPALLGGIILLWVFSVVLGLLLPWKNIIWSTYWAYPVVHFVIIIFGLIVYGRNKNP